VYPRSDQAEEAMGAFPFHASLQRLLVTAALPLGLMAAGAMPAYAGSVTVTGANGAPGYPGRPGGAGQPANADAGNLIPNSDPTNSATAQGGNGGWGGSVYIGPGSAGGAGGPATSTAKTKILTGSASATATATGGQGGKGGNGYKPGAGGAGGSATSTATASVSTGS
jgi:hypothetical protein